MRNVAALAYGQLMRTTLQFISVPVFTYFWGLEEYGIWLLLFTLPGFLAMGDLGFNVAASNAIIHAIETGDEQEAAEIFGTVRRLIFGFSITMLAVAAVVLSLRPELIAWVAAGGVPALPTVLALIGYGLVCLFASTTLGGFRSTGAFAEAVFIFETTASIEIAISLGVLALGGNLLHVALAYLLVRITGSVISAVYLRRRAPVLFAPRKRTMRAVLRDLSGPAVAVMAVPIGHAVSLQGTVAVIGAVAGPAVVPLFTTARTLSRLPVQLTQVLVSAAMPQITKARARGDKPSADRLVGSVLGLSSPLLFLALLVLAIFGQRIISIWTHGVVHADAALVAVLMLSAFIYAHWLMISNFILAANRQALYSYFFLGAAVVDLGAIALLVPALGVEGAGLAVLLLDAVMLVWCIWQAARIDILGLNTLRHVLSGGVLSDIRLLTGRNTGG